MCDAFRKPMLIARSSLILLDDQECCHARLQWTEHACSSCSTVCQNQQQDLASWNSNVMYANSMIGPYRGQLDTFILEPAAHHPVHSRRMHRLGPSSPTLHVATMLPESGKHEMSGQAQPATGASAPQTVPRSTTCMHAGEQAPPCERQR
jgi:hypothetical protein